MKASVFIATSLDGHVARADGSIDWLPGPSGDEDYGYKAFIDRIDVHVIGRRTFEQVLTFGAWPYEKRVVVLSSRPVSLPRVLPPNVETSSAAPAPLMAHLANTGATHAYVDGANTVQRFLAARLIDEMIITRIPIVLGSGIPLFASLDRDIPLTHVGTRAFDDGLVQSRYRVDDQQAAI